MRKLTKEDLIRANIPPLYWDNKLKNIPDRVPYKTKIRNYMKDIRMFAKQGIGLYLWCEENSTGKTAIATLILKQAIREGLTVLFIPSFELIRSTFNKTPFDDTSTLFQRAHEVDILVIDDADKEYKDKKGYSDNIVENVVRSRNQNKKATLLTSNLPPKEIKVQYSKGLAELLRECAITIEIVAKKDGGVHWRAEKEKKLKELL